MQYKSKKHIYRSVNEALSAVVNKLETREDIAYLKKNLVGDSIHSLVQAFTKDPILALNDKLDSLLKSDENFRPPLPRGNQPPSQVLVNSNLNTNGADPDTIIAYSQLNVLTRQFPNGFTIELNTEFDPASWTP